MEIPKPQPVEGRVSKFACLQACELGFRAPADDYTAGYLQRLTASVNMLEPEAVVYDQRLIYFRAGYGNQAGFRAAIGKQLGVIHAVVGQYLQSLEVEHKSGVARSLQCFDLEHWHEQNFSRMPRCLRCLLTLRGWERRW